MAVPPARGEAFWGARRRRPGRGRACPAGPSRRRRRRRRCPLLLIRSLTVPTERPPNSTQVRRRAPPPGARRSRPGNSAARRGLLQVAPLAGGALAGQSPRLAVALTSAPPHSTNPPPPPKPTPFPHPHPQPNPTRPRGHPQHSIQAHRPLGGGRPGAPHLIHIYWRHRRAGRVPSGRRSNSGRTPVPAAGGGGQQARLSPAPAASRCCIRNTPVPVRECLSIRRRAAARSSAAAGQAQAAAASWHARAAPALSSGERPSRPIPGGGCAVCGNLQAMRLAFDGQNQSPWSVQALLGQNSIR
jgi:hypothetical protein